jgi:hypothetical protein
MGMSASAPSREIFLIQELLEQGGLVEFVENPGLLFPGQHRSIAAWFHALLQPLTLRGILQVHVLHPD